MSPEDQDKLEGALFPFLRRRQRRVINRKMRFVHYTSAAAAESLFKNKTIWLRNTTCMNDFSEVQHGLRCADIAWEGDGGKALRNNLNKIFPGIDNEIATFFRSKVHNLLYGTYVACFSEHLNKEDRYGRLSMWRAYGSSVGLAVVLNPAVFFARSNALRAYTSPVEYLDDTEFQRGVYQIAANIDSHAGLIESLGREVVQQIVFQVLRFAVLCTKHPAFSEEREWRVVYTPALERSPRVIESVRVVKGLPQTVFEIPLENVPGEGLVGLEIPELVERVIIGPTQFHDATYDAFFRLLFGAGIKEPQHRLFKSHVPLRL